MRLLRLDLEKYGAFEGRILTFRPDARLHVVYGPNEAGKSSALSAVGDLLFGFGARTEFAFRHATGDLRLGARLVASGGEEVSFRRRKGKSGTIVGADDKPLRDDLLAPFLGQLTRETFERAFGLASDSLRAGADDLLSADGDGASSLFAAASGLRGVENLRRALDGEADALFSPQARTRPFNDLAKRHQGAQQAQREHELGATQWKRLNDEIEALEERHLALDAERARARTERARLERLTRAHGASVELAQAHRALEALREVLEVSPEAAETLAIRLEAYEAAEAAGARAAETLAVADAEFGRADVDEQALGAAAEVEALMVRSGAFQTYQLDIPRVRREVEGLDEQLAQLAVRLGLTEGRGVKDALPTDAARAALKALITEGSGFAPQREQRARAIAGERENLMALEARVGDGKPVDPRPVRQAFVSLAQRFRPLERLSELVAERDREARALDATAARLSPPVDDLARLAGRHLPSAEAIGRWRRELDRLSLALARAEETGVGHAAEIARLDGELARLDSQGPISTPETIAAARAARDAAWTPLRDRLTGGRLGQGDPAAEIGVFELAGAEADRLADRLALDAGRAARREDVSRARGEAEASRASVARRLGELRAEREGALRDWSGIWEDVGVSPASPEEMDGWRREVLALSGRLDQNGERDAAIARLERLERDARPELDRLAAAVGLGPEPDTLRLAARLDARLAELSDSWTEANALAMRLAEAQGRMDRLEREQTETALQEEHWRGRWIAALPGLGLSTDAPLEAADAALSAWSEAPALTANRDALAQRVRGMERESRAYRDDVAAQVAASAPDLADLPPEAAARRLNERVLAARAADARRAEARRRRGEAAESADAARRAMDAAKAALVAASAGLPQGVDIRSLLARIAERNARAADVSGARKRLLERGETADEAALLAELSGFEPDAAPAAIDRLAAEERRIELDAQQLWAELHAARAGRDALGGAGAEKAAAEGRAVGAALHEMAREWSVAKLASLLLGAAIDRARAEDRSPTLERAGRLFATLTGGAFSGFAEDYEDDALVLFGRRGSGESVPVRGMSEGTRDQFYLALRLAALEDYASRAEPAPFIGDDLFASFDDARASHGLKALAEIGKSVQPILFTHHRAVVEAARGTLGDEVDVIEIASFTR